MRIPTSLSFAVIAFLSATNGVDAFFFKRDVSSIEIPDVRSPSVTYLNAFSNEDDFEAEYELVDGDDHEFDVNGQHSSLRKRADGCQKYHTVRAGDTCYSLAERYGIDLFQLYAWNDQINKHCTNLFVNKRYCVDGPKAPQATSNTCEKRHKVIAGDTCVKLAKAYNISLEEFYKLNPRVNRGACDNLKVANSYCVAAGKSAHSNKAQLLQKPSGAADKNDDKNTEDKTPSKSKASASGKTGTGKPTTTRTSTTTTKTTTSKSTTTTTTTTTTTQRPTTTKRSSTKTTTTRRKTSSAKPSPPPSSSKYAEDEVTSSSSKEQRRRIQKDVALTYYWIAHPEDYPSGGKSVQIKTCGGETIATVSQNYADALVMEGSGVAGSKMVNLGGCSCVNYRCFMELDKNEDPYGLTAHGSPLRPYITIAANDIKKGTKIFVPSLEGLQLPGTNMRHNGCFLVDDESWSFSSNHIDLYVYRMQNYRKLIDSHGVSKVDVYEGGDCKLLNYM
ncbi:uncharacterized protein BYT42DRAFT_568148 [Radiomyces spectabilis]|uniref:uncharacterized protein n=1 Tax=Radiomyces spectabilis TaxID=64574 RepID=UPI00221F227C|nr:uncharacterized protein BYT42DRAFT_568148 [Radiomyces spectabilis]KAI8379235.1 hypothetical protein BYT42DRAFT_568148 [Radiomyces spectabilis]